MTELWAFVALLVIHWVGDYVCQSRWMGDNKSKRLDALAAHVGVYTLVLAVGSATIFPIGHGLALFVAGNCAAHAATDFVTSRAIASLWAKKRAYETFLVMGADQLIHQVTLAATMVWFLSR
jgi:hypothetical protein